MSTKMTFVLPNYLSVSVDVLDSEKDKPLHHFEERVRNEFKRTYTEKYGAFGNKVEFDPTARITFDRTVARTPLSERSTPLTKPELVSFRLSPSGTPYNPVDDFFAQNSQINITTELLVPYLTSMRKEVKEELRREFEEEIGGLRRRIEAIEGNK